MGERKSKKIDVSEVETLVASRGQDIPLQPPNQKKWWFWSRGAKEGSPKESAAREKGLLSLKWRRRRKKEKKGLIDINPLLSPFLPPPLRRGSSPFLSGLVGSHSATHLWAGRGGGGDTSTPCTRGFETLLCLCSSKGGGIFSTKSTTTPILGKQEGRRRGEIILGA